MSSKTLLLACLLAFGAIATSIHAAEVEVVQKDKKFSQSSVKIKVGDAVSFKNEDPFIHNIFSLSDTKTFDLGSYPKGQSKKVVFDQPGTIEIECSIHPEMKMVVEVRK